MSEWIDALAFGELEPSSAVRVDLVDTEGATHRVAVVRIDDSLYAIGDRCSHADVSLAEGTVYDDECQLECIKHGSLFSLISGEAVTFPATRPVPVFAVRRDGDRVLVQVPGEIHAAKPHDDTTNAWSSASTETAAQAKQGPAASEPGSGESTETAAQVRQGPAASEPRSGESTEAAAQVRQGPAA